MATLLLDGQYFITRFAHSPDSTDLSPTARFMEILWTYKQYGDIVVAFDGRRPKFRTDLYPDYKKKDRSKLSEDKLLRLAEVRSLVSKNVPALTKLLRCLGIPAVRHSEFEGDDQIYRLVQHYRRFGEVNVMSSDSDYFQMVREGASIIRPFHDEIVDRITFREKFGFAPEFYPLFLSITGSHNGVPGVRNVGPVKATKIIQELQTPDLKGLKEWIKSEDEITGLRVPVKSHMKIIKRNLELIDMDRVPLTEFEMVSEIEKSKEHETDFREFMKLAKQAKIFMPGRWISLMG